MNWDMNYDDEIFYKFENYLLDKNLITESKLTRFKESLLLRCFITSLYFSEYEIYCKDNNFLYESLKELRG